MNMNKSKPSDPTLSTWNPEMAMNHYKNDAMCEMFEDKLLLWLTSTYTPHSRIFNANIVSILWTLIHLQKFTTLGKLVLQILQKFNNILQKKPLKIQHLEETNNLMPNLTHVKASNFISNIDTKMNNPEVLQQR